MARSHLFPRSRPPSLGGLLGSRPSARSGASTRCASSTIRCRAHQRRALAARHAGAYTPPMQLARVQSRLLD